MSRELRMMTGTASRQANAPTKVLIAPRTAARTASLTQAFLWLAGTACAVEPRGKPADDNVMSAVGEPVTNVDRASADDGAAGGEGEGEGEEEGAGEAENVDAGPGEESSVTPENGTSPTGADQDAEAGADGQGETGEQDDGSIDTGDVRPVRFIALGDTGEGNTAQYAVAAAIEDVCRAQGCDFALLLGDNFYDTGVVGLDDPQWQMKFELPYEGLDFPFYPVLGNHDGGIFGAGIQIEPGNLQVDYSSVSSKWTMPARWYMHSHNNADFFALDSSTIFFEELGLSYDDMVEEQRQFVAESLAASAPDRWRFAYAHHPYLSNGRHGNAGAYDGVSFLPTVNGAAIRDFVEANLCGQVDFFLSGHDHNRQWHVNTCDGTQFIVSGAGAKLTSFEDSQPVHFADDAEEGFVWFEIVGATLKVQFWNRLGEMEFERTLTKGS